MMHSKNGRLEVICGSMFSGKTEELIRRLRRAELAQQKTHIFKPAIDTRRDALTINSHNGSMLPAFLVHDSSIVLTTPLTPAAVVGIDEVQFFDERIVDAILILVEKGHRVIVAGLDLDFRGIPFGCVPQLLALADSITKLNAVCIACGADAHFTQRLINGKPARFDEPIFLLGVEDCYQARCRGCYQIER
jgi:thymidine kinase